MPPDPASARSAIAAQVVRLGREGAQMFDIGRAVGLSADGALRERLTLLEISAYWVLGQVRRPTAIPAEFYL